MLGRKGEIPALKLPLHVFAACGSTLLLLTVACVLALHAYRSTRTVISSTVDESIRHVSRSLKDRIHSILQPAENQLELFTYHDIVRAKSLQDRLRSVPMALSVLASNPLMDAWYVGYTDGDFVLFRALNDSAIRKVFRAPEHAAMMVQSVARQSDGERRGEYFFFDKAGRELTHRL